MKVLKLKNLYFNLSIIKWCDRTKVDVVGLNIFNNTNQVFLSHGYFDRPGSIASACYFIKLKYAQKETALHGIKTGDTKYVAFYLCHSSKSFTTFYKQKIANCLAVQSILCLICL